MTATIPMGPHAVVTLTLDDATPTRAAAEASRRRFDHDDEPITKPKQQQPAAQVERCSKR